MKKKLIVVLMLLFCFSCLFANGGVEAKQVESEYGAGGLVGQTLRGIGNTFGTATRSIVLALHPFPNILTRFYSFVDGAYSSTYDGSFSSDMLLTSSDYYTTSGFTQVDKDEKTGQAKVTVSGSDAKLTISETDVGTGKLQKTRWTITSYLFIIFFAAEVIFTAVFGYIAPQDENSSLLRQIGVSAAMTLMLFILAAALPFLVEAVRYGLFQIANLYTPVTFDSMFDMPATFMGQMANLMESLSWRNEASAIFNKDTNSLSASILGKLLSGFVYVIFEFVMGLQAIKAGVHIVANIIEVYLLLSLVMVMLPISVFTPLRGVTRKCVYSLFSNLIECFVLCFIIILVVPACITGCNNLQELAKELNNYTGNNLKLLASEVLTFKDNTTLDISWGLEFVAQGSDYVVMASWTTAYDNGRATMYLDKDSSLYKAYAGDYNLSWAEANSTGVTAKEKPEKLEFEERETYFKARTKEILSFFRYAAHGSNLAQHSNMAHCAGWATKAEEKGSYPTVSSCMKYGRQYAKQIMNNTKAIESEETYSENSSVVSGLLIAWVFLYLPCFFVMQSTQITNALSQGTAGHESFANALSHTGAQMMQAVTTGANLVKNGVAMSAGVSGHMAQKGMAEDVSSMQDAMQKMADKDSQSNSQNGG
jgi:hypothetical protein